MTLCRRQRLELIDRLCARQEVRDRHHPSVPPPSSRYYFNVQSRDSLTSSSAFTRRNPERWEFQVRSPLTRLPHLPGAGGPTVSVWWSVGHAKWPLPLSSRVDGVPVLFLPRGRQQASADSGVLSGSLSAVGTSTHPLRMCVHRPPFRILSSERRSLS